MVVHPRRVRPTQERKQTALRNWGLTLWLMIQILSMTLRTLNYGNYGIFLIMGKAENP